MGYYTDFQLDYELTRDPGYPEPDTAAIQAALEEISGYGWDEWADTLMLSNAKWYEEKDHMYSLSKQFPQVIFHLHGEGENSDDVWEEHWQNGCVQTCVAEFPPFDPKKMQPYRGPIAVLAPDGELEEEVLTGLTELL